MRYIIIGSGIAGITAANTIRDHDTSAEITVYTNEVHPIGLYARNDMVRQFAVGHTAMEDLLIQGEDALRARDIRIEYEEVLTVFPQLRQVLKARHLRHVYDRLLIASGATPRLVEAPGIHHIGVHQLRNYEDLSLIETWMPELQTQGVAVIGGGILGLDMAYALRQRGILTSLVVRDERLGYPALSEDQGRPLHTVLLDAGVDIIFNETVVAYLSEDDRVLDAIQLSSGRVIPVRMALCAVGVQPTTEFVEESHIELEDESRAIVVNEHMQTNFRDIFAAGNCASIGGYISSTWKQSAEQGRVAALNMVGQQASYSPSRIETITPLILEPTLSQI